MEFQYLTRFRQPHAKWQVCDRVKKLYTLNSAVTEINTKLSSSITVAKFRALERAIDKDALSRFIVERFNERYFWLIEDSSNKHGFTVLAVACLIVETLESFYQGLPNTKHTSAKMFRDFFARDTKLKAFAGEKDWFYKDIRCGILHQGETRGGWRVLRKGPILDLKNKTINATAFLKALRTAVQNYSVQLRTDDALWKNFRKKMNAICANCE